VPGKRAAAPPPGLSGQHPREIFDGPIQIRIALHDPQARPVHPRPRVDDGTLRGGVVVMHAGTVGELHVSS